MTWRDVVSWPYYLSRQDGCRGNGWRRAWKGELYHLTLPERCIALAVCRERDGELVYQGTVTMEKARDIAYRWMSRGLPFAIYTVEMR